jgi:sigma54-dependent transcription regulator
MKGAFTGAQQRKQGLVEAADGGTLFLDEIGDLPLSQQVKLIAFAGKRQLPPSGGINSIPASFRLIAATHRNLASMVAEGSFRADLYYRLAVFHHDLLRCGKEKMTSFWPQPAGTCPLVAHCGLKRQHNSGYYNNRFTAISGAAQST